MLKREVTGYKLHYSPTSQWAGQSILPKCWWGFDPKKPDGINIFLQTQNPIPANWDIILIPGR